MKSFEIILYKDSEGNPIKLDNLSLEASKSVHEILDALIKIAEYEKNKNNLELKIGLENCCAAHKLYGDDISMEIVLKNILNVIDDNDERDNEYVSQLNVIHRNILNSQTSEITINRKGGQINLKDDFIKPFREKRTRNNIKNDFKIEFIKGKLQQNGGKNPNFHLEVSHDEELTISCDIPEAIKVNKYLYQDIHISAWSKFNGKKMLYFFSDLYLEKDINYFYDFKDFFKNLENSKDTEQYHLISKKIKTYYDNLDFVSARKFIRLFINENSIPVYLRTILLNSKSFKDEEELSEMLNKIEALLQSKIGKVY
jgi:hypothetical protein